MLPVTNHIMLTRNFYITTKKELRISYKAHKDSHHEDIVKTRALHKVQPDGYE